MSTNRRRTNKPGDRKAYQSNTSLLSLMSELISLRERVAQAELVRPRLQGKATTKRKAGSGSARVS
jgi:hypothetical protein